jgi:MFS family permease
MIALMGFGYAGLYASILSYGIDQLPYSCPKLMSFLILAGTIGGVFALPFSSFFVNHFSILTALLVGLIILGMVIVCICFTLRDENNSVKDAVGSKDLSYIVRFSRYYIRKYWRRLSYF